MTSGPEFQSYMAEQGDRDEQDRNCHDCGVCEWCIQRTMEAAHEAAMTVLQGENVHLTEALARLESENASLRAERDAEKRINMLAAQDWANDYERLAEVCRKAGVKKDEVDGDGYGVPAMADLINSLESTVAAMKEELAAAVGLLRPFAAEWERRDEVPPKIGYVIGDLFAAYNWLAKHDTTLPEPPTTIAAAMDDAERDWERRYMNTEPQDEGG